MNKVNDRGAPSQILRNMELVSFFKKSNINSASLIDLGCGRGDFLVLLNRFFPNWDLAGIDFSEESVSFCKLRSDKINFICGDFLKSNLKGYDFISAFEVLEHIEDDVSAMKRIFNVLSEDGYFIGSVPSIRKRFSIVDEFAGHFRRYDKSELKQKFVDVGFEDVIILSYGFPFPMCAKWLIDILAIRENKNREKKENENKKDNNKKKKVKKNNAKLDKISYTKKSGYTQFFSFQHWIFNYYTMLPFFYLQKLFYKTDLGIGYIFIVKKKNKKII